MKVLNVDHAHKGKGGHIVRERGYCMAIDKPILDILADLEYEFETLIEEYPDEMILFSVSEMTKEELEVLPEFLGW